MRVKECHESSDDKVREEYVHAMIEAAEPETTGRIYFAFTPVELKENISEDINISFLKELFKKYSVPYEISSEKLYSLFPSRKWLCAVDGIICAIDRRGAVVPIGWEVSDILLLWQMEESGELIVRAEDYHPYDIGLYDPVAKNH